MLRIVQLKLRPDHTRADLEQRICRKLKIAPQDLLGWQIARQSIDARKLPDIFYIYSVDVQVRSEKQILKKLRGDRNVSVCNPPCFRLPMTGTTQLTARPVIIGAGPAGLFCALALARAGYRPLVFERGEAVEERTKTVQAFWEGGVLNPNSNVQFGEGGAGTFSDGKLNTLVKDTTGRIRAVLEIFAQMGADESVVYQSHPHVGTDRLLHIVKNIREEIIARGGEVFFSHCLRDLSFEDQGTTAVLTIEDLKSDRCLTVRTQAAVLALGHSARDTFELLYDRKLDLQAKAFAVGVRVQHPQKLIQENQYGVNCPYEMEPASYKVTHRLADGGGVYSFCMCPGGYVVNASSEEGRLAINGMSYQDRGSACANSALIVTVSPDEFGHEPLDGIRFQRQLEEKAFQAGEGSIPTQRFEDFCHHRPSEQKLPGCFKGEYRMSELHAVFPKRITDAIEEGIRAFDRQIPGFASPDVLLSAVESRSSSPVRINRDEEGRSTSHPCLYPCGEGAGYAGGITSAAADGLLTAAKITARWKAADDACL